MGQGRLLMRKPVPPVGKLIKELRAVEGSVAVHVKNPQSQVGADKTVDLLRAFRVPVVFKGDDRS